MNSFHGLTLLSFSSLHLFIYCQKLLTLDRYIRRSWEQFVPVSASSHYWVGCIQSFEGSRVLLFLGGAGFCMAHPLSERLRELLQCANTHTCWHTAAVLSLFSLGPRFYSGHQSATQHGAKIVNNIKVNVNVFSVFSTTSMLLRHSVKFHSVLP